MKAKTLVAAFAAMALVASIAAMPACSQQGASQESGTTSGIASNSANTDNGGMKSVPIDDQTMSLIEGTWRTKGVWFDANEPIKPLDENKNLNDQYGRYSITFNSDKTFKFQKRDTLEEGIWEYYGIENDMRSFAMKKTSSSKTGDGGGAIRSESDLAGNAIYYVYLKEMDNNDMIVVHEQGNEKEAAKPVMIKTSGPEQSAGNSSSANGATSANHSATTGERNALSKANSYLDMTAFSYTGLIEQLEYEGFTHSEAVYGADNCGADWNEQAARKAQQYLDMTSFSKSGLIEQLEYEGFTRAQAEYGVSKVYK